MANILVRENLMTQPNYSPYCGGHNCPGRYPRTEFNGEQFECPSCGFETGFPKEFIAEYKKKWDIK